MDEREKINTRSGVREIDINYLMETKQRISRNSKPTTRIPIVNGYIITTRPENHNTSKTETNEATRVCRTSGRKLPIEDFPKHRTRTDGLQTQCKECCSAKQKKRTDKYKAINRQV